MNREQFEKLEEVVKRLYSVQLGVPHKENVARYGLSAGLVTQEKIDDFRFVVGAWYAWQEQQRKIDWLLELNESLVAYKNELLEELK